MRSLKEINWKFVLTVAALSLLLGALFDFMFDFSPTMHLSWTLQADVDVTYQDLAATLLTAVGIVLAVLAAFVGIIGIRGYKDIENGAVKAVHESIRKEDGYIQKIMRQEMVEQFEKIMADKKRGTYVLKEWGNQDNEYGDE